MFESGDGDLSETTKELLAYNYQNAVTSAAKPHCSGKKCDFQPLKPIYTPYNRCVKLLAGGVSPPSPRAFSAFLYFLHRSLYRHHNMHDRLFRQRIAARISAQIVCRAQGVGLRQSGRFEYLVYKRDQFTKCKTRITPCNRNYLYRRYQFYSRSFGGLSERKTDRVIPVFIYVVFSVIRAVRLDQKSAGIIYGQSRLYSVVQYLTR